MEDPDIIRLNVRHYHKLLERHCSVETRAKVMELLAEAQAQTHLAEAEASERRR